MKLSEILGWPDKKSTDTWPSMTAEKNGSWNTALTSCDREIDREALAKAIYVDVETWDNIPQPMKELYFKTADFVISTMPTWLKPTERK